MEALTTPDERFEDLVGFPFEPRYTDIDDGQGGMLHMHHVTAGPPDGRIVLLLHGEPSWSYLYRRMIPPLAEAGLRPMAPDLIGFGKSDKPAARSDYTYQRHVDWAKAWCEAQDLDRAVLFCQDWGGLIGLRLVAEMPERFSAVAAANTGLPTGDHPPTEAFDQWLSYSQTVSEFPVGRVVNGGCVTELSDDVVAAYEAPFPDETYKAGARAFPALVPVTPDDPASAANRAAWESLMTWERPFLTLFSDSDPITAGVDGVFQKRIPGAAGQPHDTIKGAGHFLQEDQGEEIAAKLIDWIESF